MPYEIHTYKTAYAGEPSRQAFQLFNNGMPQAREVSSLEAAFAQACEVYRVYGSNVTMQLWHKTRDSRPYVPVIDVSSGLEVQRVYVARYVPA